MALATQPVADLEQQEEEQKPELSPEEKAERFERLDKLGMSLADKRKEAIEARRMCGIEEQWTQDQEFYEGIDDANRAEKQGDYQTKPPGQSAKAVESNVGSNLFPNITAPYCEAAAARIADMLLPSDDKNFAIRSTPIPDMAALAQGKPTRQMLREAAKMYPGRPDLAQNELAKATEQALQVIEEAKEKASKAETRIEDWLIESQWHAEVRKVIEDCSRLGSGVVKGPVPINRKTTSIASGALSVIKKICPGSKRLSCWDFWPDGSCGDNIHNGGFTWERDRLTAKQMLDLKETPDYIGEQIDKCLAEGPIDCASKDLVKPMALSGRDKSRYEIWYYHGFLERKDLEAAGCECEGDKLVHIPAIVTMVNNRVIKAALNPLDTGDFPYDVMPWRKKAGMPWGDGVGRQIRTPQRIVTAALRTMMVNSGRAAGPMVVWQQGKVVPADGKYELSPWKLVYVGEDGDDVDVRKAVGIIQFPSMQAELERIIQIGLKLAEDVTGLPLILQGQQGKAPDTVGGMQLLNDNASSVLRRLARTFDDYITEPHIRRYYTWLLQYGEDEEKGDFQIDARGSSALVERSIQNQELANIVQAALNPAFGLDPKKAMAEYLKSRKLDPKSFEFDDEEWKQIVENMKKGPQDPRLMVAQLRAQLEERLKQMDQHFEEQENAKDRQLALIEAEFNERLEALRQQGNRTTNFDDIKAALADTVMKLRQQKEFFVADKTVQVHQHAKDTAVDLHKHRTPPAKAPTEPHGKAKAGEAYQH